MKLARSAHGQRRNVTNKIVSNLTIVLQLLNSLEVICWALIFIIRIRFIDITAQLLRLPHTVLKFRVIKFNLKSQ